MSYSLTPQLKGDYIGDYTGDYVGTSIGVIKRDTRSLDYGSYALMTTTPTCMSIVSLRHSPIPTEAWVGNLWRIMTALFCGSDTDRTVGLRGRRIPEFLMRHCELRSLLWLQHPARLSVSDVGF